MMHSVVENKRKPVTWALKATWSLCLKGVTEQKVAQKQAEEKRERENQRALCFQAVLVAHFITEVEHFAPGKIFPTVMKGPDVIYFCTSRATLLPAPASLQVLLRRQNKWWDWNKVLVHSKPVTTHMQNTGTVCFFVLVHMFQYKHCMYDLRNIRDIKCKRLTASLENKGNKKGCFLIINARTDESVSWGNFGWATFIIVICTDLREKKPACVGA